MFENKFIAVPWAKLIGTDQILKFRLLSYTKRQAPTWESYYAQQRSHFFREGGNEQKFKAETRQEYKHYLEYLKLWCGAFYEGDEIYLIPYRFADPQVLLATKNPYISGQDMDNNADLELWLFAEVTGFFKKLVALQCRAYSSGTDILDKSKLYARLFPEFADPGRYDFSNIAYSEGVLKIEDAVFSKITGYYQAITESEKISKRSQEYYAYAEEPYRSLMRISFGPVEKQKYKSSQIRGQIKTLRGRTRNS